MIKFDSEKWFEKTLDFLEDNSNIASNPKEYGQLIIAIGKFYNKLDEVIVSINSKFFK